MVCQLFFLYEYPFVLMMLPISTKDMSKRKQQGNPIKDAAKFKKEHEILEKPIQLLQKKRGISQLREIIQERKIEICREANGNKQVDF